MATADEIIVRLTAQTDQLKAGMAEGAAVVKATQDEMAASMQTSMNAFRQFDAITKESVKSTEGLAAAQKALAEAQASGAFTTEELASKQALVDAAMVKVGKETATASGAMSAFTSNSRTMYSASALITDAMTGQFSRMRREVAALANETGLMSAAFRMLLGPMGGVAAGAGIVALTLLKGEEESSKFTDSLIATGNYAGTTEGAMNALAQSIAGGATTIGAARGVVLAFAESGRFTHDQLQLASEAAVSFANVAHVSMDEAVQAIVRIQEDPVGALQKLNEQYHFVNQAQLDAVASLVKQGETTKAVSLAIDDFGTVMHTRAVQAEQDVGYMEEAWRGLKNVISDTVNWMEQAGRKVTLQAQLEEADHDLQLIRDHGETVGRMIIAMEATGSKLFSNPANYTVDKLTAKVQGLQAQIAAANKEAEGQGAETQANTTIKPHVGGAGGIGALETQFKEQEAAAHASYDQMKVDAADFWNAQATDARNSAAVQADAWQKFIDARHQLDAEGLRNESEADRKREESALKSAEAAKRAAQDRARAEQRTSQDTQRDIQKETALRLQALAGEQAMAQKRLDIDRQELQDQYDAHQISAAQLLQGELKLDDELLAAELAYLNKKKELDAGDVGAVAKDQQQVTLVTLDAQQKRLQDLDRFHKQSEQKWKQYTQRVDGMVASQVNAMLFQHQTLRAAIANIAESMTETWIGNEIKQLMNTQSINAAKLAAKASSDQAQVASTATAAAETRGIEQAANMKSITSAAATAAAKAFQALAGIPIVGPILGAIAAAGTFVAVEAFGASARGGWERVPADGINTVLHRDEMVLPKHVADPVRKMARAGGNGGAMNVHIHTTDSRNLTSYLKRNPAALRAALAHAGRNGW